ncbi:MAG: nucleotide exchange factor GrpE, partial [Rhodomicrobium sp.]
MTDQTARAEDAADPPEAAASTNQPAAAEADAVALAAELKDRLLRTLAEMENLRKRTAREVTEARLYGVTSFAHDMFAVADNMRRALDAVSPELRASAEPGVKALIDGVELTERELLKAL